MSAYKKLENAQRIAIIICGVCFICHWISIYSTKTINLRNGSLTYNPALSPPFVLGILFFYSIIPIVIFVAKLYVGKPINLDSNLALTETENVLENEKTKVQELYSLGVFSKEELETKLKLISTKQKQEIISKENEKREKEELEKRMEKEARNLKELETANEHLLSLKKEGLLSEEEYFEKLNNLSKKKEKAYLKTIIDKPNNRTIAYLEKEPYKEWGPFWGYYYMIPIIFEDDYYRYIFQVIKSKKYFYPDKTHFFELKEDCIIALYNAWKKTEKN